VGDQLTVPCQDGVRPRYRCNLGESLAAQSMTDLNQAWLAWRPKLQTSFHLGPSEYGFPQPNIRSAPAVLSPPSGDV